MATATYPPAPPYYKLYKDYLQNPDSAPKPPPPVQGTSVLYGANYTKELRSLNRELQLQLLEFVDVLVERPSQYARRVEHISLIFKNLHHLVNSHQARATLIQRCKQAVEDIKRRRGEAQRLLQEVLGTLDGQ